MRRLIGAALAVLLGAAPALTQEETIRIGFRKDAKPFSFEDPAAALGVNGFLAQLCVRAFDPRVTDKRIEVVWVKSKERFGKLRSSSPEDRIDILCDPTSVTMDRANEFLFTNLVFASGVGYLRNPAAVGGDTIVGSLAETTAPAAVNIAIQQGRVKSLKGRRIIRDEDVSSHEEGIARICAAEFEYYFGDLDIIRAMLADATESGVSGCEDVVDSENVTFSYEAYALATAPRRPDLAVFLQSRIFRLFSDGTARQLFQTHFPERAPSAALQAILALNAIYPCGDILEEDPCRGP